MNSTYKIAMVSLVMLFASLMQANAQVTFTLDADTVTCVVNTGRIEVNITSGLGPYNYRLYNGDPFGGGVLIQSSLNNPSATHYFNSLVAGTYFVQASNAGGGSYTSIPVVDVKKVILTVLETLVSKRLSCPEGSDANLLAQVRGGNPPYTYLWSPGGETTPNKNGVGRGTYTVIVNDSYNCGTLATKYDLIFDELHDSFPTTLVPGTIAVASLQACINSTPAPFTSSLAASGGWTFSYQWQRNSATLGTWTNIPGATLATFTESTPLTENTQYRRAAISGEGCGTVYSNILSITVNPLPTLYDVTGGGSYCSGGTGVPVGLSNSQSGINYQLYRGAVAVGSPVSGTGAAISFGNQTIAGTYTVTGTNGTTTCTATMNGNAVITINPLPTAFNVTGGGSYCSGGTGVSVGLSGSEVGMNYQLFVGAAPVGAPIAGTGAALNFGLQTSAGTYTITSTNTITSCVATMTGSAIITINPLPTVYNMSGGGAFCSGGAGVAVGLSGSQSGVNYQLYRDGLPVGGAVPGTGAALGFGSQTIAGTYTAVATNATTTCVANMNGTAVVSVNPLPNLFNITGGGAYCSGGAGVPIGIDGSQVGVNYRQYRGASAVGGARAGTGLPITFPNQTVAGTYRVRAINATTGCILFMNGTVDVIVNPLPTAYNVTGGGSYCAGGTGVNLGLANSAIGTDYQLLRDGLPVGGLVAGTGGALNFGLQTTAGTYTVTATIAATGCSGPMTGSAVVSINPLPIVYDVTGGGAYCSGGTGVNVGLNNSTSGVNYQLYRGAVAVGSPLSGTGAAISFGNQTTAGTYTVVATNATTSCTSNMNGSAVVSINPLPTSYNVTGGGSFCTGGAGVIVGLSGSDAGTDYQLYLGALAIGGPVSGTGAALSFGNQTSAGTYTVQATNTLTSCIATMSGTAIVSINLLPTTFNVTGGGAYCSGGTGLPVGLSGSEININYQLFRDGNPVGGAIPGTGAAISFGNQTTAGTYTVVATNTITICVANMNGSAIVSINPLPATFNVTGGGAYCSGGTGVLVGLNGSEAGVNYQLFLGAVPTGSPVAGTGAAISFGNQTAAGTYTVVATNGTTSCLANMSGNAVVSISPLPNVYSVTGGGSYCSGGIGLNVGLNGSDAGTNYQLFADGIATGAPVSGTGGIISFGLQTTAASYTVTATIIATSCTSPMSGSVVININPLPSIFNVTGGGSYCSGGTGVPVGLSGSESGVNYQLYRDGVPVGAVVGGTGVAISFGNQTTVGNYTVVATNATTSCTSNMNGSVAVSIDPLPTAFNVTGGGGYCSGGSGVPVGLSGSEVGVNYQLFRGAVAIGAPIAGSGAALSFGNQTLAGTYTVRATNAVTSCLATMTGNAVVSINPLPTVFSMTGGGSYCAGGIGVNVGLSSSQNGVNYQLYRDGNPVGGSIPGSGLAISFGNQTIAGTYTAVATNAITSCTSNMSGTAVVSIDPLPITYNVTGGGSYCSGGAGVIVGLDGSEAGVNYQLYLGAATTGSPVAGTGAAISFGAQTAAGNYTVVATNASTSCTSNMNGSAVVSINPLPTSYNVSGGGSFCSGGAGVNVSLNNSDIGTDYELYLDGVPLGIILPGTGGILSFGNQTAAGSYTVEATVTATGCSAPMAGSALITIDPLPTTYNVTGGGSYCSGGFGLPVDLDGSESGVNYQLFLNGIASGFPISGTGLSISFGNQILAGTYTISAINTTTGCSALMNGSTIISINPLPAATASNNGPVCEGNSLSLFGGVNPANTYSWSGPLGFNSTNQNPLVSLSATTAMSGNYTVIVLDLNSCTNSATTTVVVDPAPLIDAGNDTAICNSDVVPVNGASILGGTLDRWRTSGDGTFDNANILNPVYTPGILDRAAGIVTLYLDVNGSGTCGLFTDSLLVTIPSPVQPAIGEPAPFYIAPSTVMEVCITTSGHQRNIDMGYYLIAPDGLTSVTLARAPMEINFTNPCTPASTGNPGNAINLCFTNNPADPPLNICTDPRPLTGDHLAEGDWSALYGLNPAQGGWTVMIKDTANNRPTIDDGAITDASVSFTDIALATGLPKTVDHNSGAINVPIIELTNNKVILLRDLTVSCFGECDAQAIVTVLGGTQPYVTYNWTPLPISGNGADTVNLCAGTYNLTVTDALGCSGSTSVNVLNPPQIVFTSLSYPDSLQCNGDSTGVVVAKATGGTGLLTYTLQPGNIPSASADSGLFNALPAGNYTVQVTDATGCQIDSSLVISQPIAISIDTAYIRDAIRCFGDTTASIVVSAIGGSAPYTYLLEPAMVSNDSGIFVNLGAGNYIVRVTDQYGCQGDTAAMTITQPTELEVDTLILEPIACFGNLATIRVVVQGGSPAYEVSVDSMNNWLSTNDTAVFGGLIAGNYYIYLRDANGCSDSAGTVVITEPAAIQITSLNYTDSLLCSADTNGTIVVKATGGTGSLTYFLQPGNIPSASADSGLFINLGANVYTTQVIDSLGCIADSIVPIWGPSVLVLDTTYISAGISCFGDTIGEITAIASGGTMPYTYILYPDLDTNSTGIFSNLGANTYFVKVYDVSGCDTLTSATLSLTVSTPLLIDTILVDPISCYGDSTSLSIVSSGGTAPYDVNLTFGGSTFTNTGVNPGEASVFLRPAGMHYIQVVDAAGCFTEDSILVLEPASALIFDSILTTPVSGCSDSANGTIRAYVSGGWGAYEYSRDGITYTPSNSFIKLTQGNYTIYVTDSLGCSITSTLQTIGGPSPLLANAIVQNAVGETPGSITFMSMGGTPPYTYWIGTTYIHDTLRTYSTDPLFDSLNAGTYFVAVRDANGCTDEDVVFIDNINLDVQLSFTCAYINGPLIEISILNGFGDITVIDSVGLGTPDTTVYFYDNISSNPYYLPVYDTGWHKIRVSDAFLFFDTTLYVTFPIIDTVLITPKTCSALGFDGNPTWDGAAEVVVNGGTANKFYRLDVHNPSGVPIIGYKNNTTGIFTGLGQYNWYNAFVIDEQNCSDSISYRDIQMMYSRYVQVSGLYNDTTVCKYNQLELFAGYSYPSQFPTQKYTVSATWTPDTAFIDFNNHNLTPSATALILNDSITIHLRLEQTEVAECMLLDSIKIKIFDAVDIPYSLAQSAGYGIDPITGEIMATVGAQINVSMDSAYRHTDILDALPDSLVKGNKVNPLFFPPNAPHEHIIFAPSDSTGYYALMITEDGCSETDTIIIDVRPVIESDSLYNVFTPNGDGHNDTWVIPYVHLYYDAEVEIFNRWGQMVYYRKGYGSDTSNEWDGKSMKNGKELPLGTYFFIIKPNDGQTETLTGTVTIIR